MPSPDSAAPDSEASPVVVVPVIPIAALPVPSATPVLKFVTYDQLTVDGKLGGPAADLMVKRPELIPAVLDLLKAREAQQAADHDAELVVLQQKQADREAQLKFAHAKELAAIINKDVPLPQIGGAGTPAAKSL